MSRAIWAASLLSSVICAQPAFDVASVRVSQGKRESIQASPGSLNMRNVTLKSAIRWAYHVMDYQVKGPDWINFDRYDIVAKAAEPATEDQLRLMLQPLLAERFKLTLHKETKELPAYSLVVAKGGIKFHESQITDGDGEPVANPDKGSMTMELKSVSAELFVERLSKVVQAPVVNNTGLSGRYDVKINVGKYIPDGSGKDGPFDPVAMIITSLQEELGLKLESKKVRLDLLIVDRVEKVPVEN
jgi:uncharacterized protein (TIGR03435 family)